MTPERRQQIKQVFHAARECAPEARVAYLDEACRADAELRQEVASLLLAYEDLGDFMQQPVLAAAQQPEPSIEPVMLQAGQQIGPYRIERHLGTGGMGVVYLARDTRLGRPVTLKLLPPRFTQDRERMRRFQQEARAASSLNHPNLLTIYEVGQMEAEVGGAYYIVAEFVAGQTLRALSRDATLQLGPALDLAIQLTDALAAAHAAGIIHRDIKPENVMLRPDGIVKVLDFGLAKLSEARNAERGTRNEEAELLLQAAQGDAPAPLDTPHSALRTSHSTMPGLILGTVAYMSPEQARGLKVDVRSDLFSAGTVLYELLTGRKPFQGETQSDVLAALLERDPPPLTYYITGLPAALQQIVTRALAKVPSDRYQTAQEFGEVLRQLKKKLEFAAHVNRTADKAAPLSMKVGATAQDDVVTQVLVAPTGAQHSSLRFRAPWSGRARQVMGIGAALALLLLGLLLGRHWRQANDTSLNSVAVLPFLNVGNDPQKEYLSDAITESLIDSLSRLPSLSVSSPNTVASYKSREVDPRQVGKDLRVRAVVTGRVGWQGEKIIVRAELVDASDGSRLWGEEFQPARADILTTQAAIVREIAAKLHRRLSPESQQQLARRHTNDSAAYELYAQGRRLYFQDVYKYQEQALDYFRQAIAHNPQYALAYCGIADVYADLSSQWLPPGEAMPKAREAALKALELDETLPEAHHSLALVKLWGDWDWAGAEREYKRALELNPQLIHTRLYYAEMLTQQRRFAEALREIKRVKEYDPVSTAALAREGDVYYLMRQDDEALTIFRNLLELRPDNFGMRQKLVLSLSLKGLHQEALIQLRPLETMPALGWLAAYIYARAGQREEALKRLQRMKEYALQERVSAFNFARVYMGLGDHEQALAWLRRGYNERLDHLLHIGADPSFDPLRADPRFTELLRGIGLTP